MYCCILLELQRLAHININNVIASKIPITINCMHACMHVT